MAQHHDLMLQNVRRTIALDLTPISVRDDAPIVAHPAESRVGGPAFVSDTWPWPATPDGKPMLHVAQLNLAELPQPEGFPSDGLLQFFVANNGDYGMTWDNYPHNLASPNHRTVRYIPAADLTDSASNPRAEGSLTTQVDSITDGYFTVTGQLCNQFLTLEDAEAVAILENHGVDIYSEDLEEFFYERDHPTTVFGGGWASFTQNDPRDRPSEQMLLLQLDTHVSREHPVQMVWGDMGIANFFITREDLANLDFSNVLYTWDCG